MTALVASVWERVVGQDRAVELLQRAVEHPTHAYLLVGARGSGVEEAARCFAAALVAPDGDARAIDLALRGAHADIVEIDPPANQIRLLDAQQIIDEAYRSPIEGARKVILVFDAERLNDQAANKLLKTLEEPPPTTLLVLVTAGADQLLATIRSRCQRVDFAFLSHDSVVCALVSGGVDPERAELLARLAGGRVDRARALDARLAPVRDAFVAATAQLDGTGAAVAAQSERLQESVKAAVADLEASQEAEAAELEGELEAAGYPDRTRRAQMRRLDDHQRRVHRHARAEALIEGITALETVYRDALATGAAPSLNADRAPLVLDPRASARALDACRAARQALIEHNPNESLMLERLLLHLPSGVGRSAS
jgi:DNA polymerase-3 subunit delta'